MKPLRVIWATLVLTGLVIPTIAGAAPADNAADQADQEKPLKILIADPNPREFAHAVHESMRANADLMAENALRKWGGIGSNGQIRYERMRPVFIDLSALKADHRDVDFIIKNGMKEEFAWCIGEKMLITLFPGQQIMVENVSIKEFGVSRGLTDEHGRYTYQGKVVDGESGSVRLAVDPTLGTVYGNIAVGDEVYKIRPMSDRAYHVIWEVDVDAINALQGGDDVIDDPTVDPQASLSIKDRIRILVAKMLDSIPRAYAVTGGVINLAIVWTNSIGLVPSDFGRESEIEGLIFPEIENAFNDAGVVIFLSHMEGVVQSEITGPSSDPGRNFIISARNNNRISSSPMIRGGRSHSRC